MGDGIELQYKYRVNVWKSKKSSLQYKKTLIIEIGWKMRHVGLNISDFISPMPVR